MASVYPSNPTTVPMEGVVATGEVSSTAGPVKLVTSIIAGVGPMVGSRL